MSEISAAAVNQLRAKTGVGLMACKKVLIEANGDENLAIEILRKKGLADAIKKSTKEASQGIIESYIHNGSQIGVLLELNSETDFVARTDDFKQLAKDICMQIAAAKPLYVSREEVANEIVEKERAIAKEQCKDKPAQAQTKIIEGKLNKWFSEICLLEQSFIKDTNLTIQHLISEKVAKMGENIKIRRFARFEVGM